VTPSIVDLETEESVLVVVEGNAATHSWPAHFGAPPEQGWTLLEQEEWEPQGAFLKRMGSTLERSRLGESSKQVVILVAGSWLDEETLRTRAHLANEIVGHLALSGGGTLLLTHGHLHDPLLRSELTSLGIELTEEWDDPRLVVQTRFVRPSWIPEPRRVSDRPRVYAAPQAAAAR
jgi:hypothetical protein